MLAVLRTTESAGDGAALTAIAREVIDDERARLAEGTAPRGIPELAEDARRRLADLESAGVEPVINATGVIIHTNLGRAPWPEAIAAAAAGLASGSLLLEMDLATGRRGARARVAEDHLVALTGAEDALVTNNNAAAVALAVGLAGRGGVVVSRGELVEIGGGVRIPEIVRRAGARLIEVGTTNRTRAADFEAPLAEGRAPRGPPRPSVQLHDGRVHRDARCRRGGRDRAPARGDRHRRSRLAARCSTRRRSGSPTSHSPGNGSRPARTS